MKYILIIIIILLSLLSLNCSSISKDPEFLYNKNYKMYESYSATRERLFRVKYDSTSKEIIYNVLIEINNGNNRKYKYIEAIFYKEGDFGVYEKEEGAYSGGIFINPEDHSIEEYIANSIKYINKFRQVKKNELPKLYNFPELNQIRLIIITNKGYYYYENDSNQLKEEEKDLFDFYHNGIELSKITNIINY
jgi:hypothetical protein